MFVLGLGLCNGRSRSLGKTDQFRSLAPQNRAATTSTSRKLIRDLGNVHATAGLAKFRYVEIQASAPLLKSGQAFVDVSE